MSKELEEDDSDAGEPKDGDATVVTSEGKKSKAAKKVSLETPVSNIYTIVFYVLCNWNIWENNFTELCR